MKITRTKVTASNYVEVPDEAGFEAWIYEKFGMKKSEVSSAKWEELGTKYFNKYRSETIKKNATYKDDKRLSPTSLRYKGYLIILDRGGDGYNVYDKYRELEDAGFASLDDAKKFVDGMSIESSVRASIDLTDDQLSKLEDISYRYVSSRPVSGDWSTEVLHEMNAIAKELHVSKADAKQIMIDELGFEESQFKSIESSVRASRSTRPGDIIIIKKDYPVGWVDGEDLYLPAGTRLEYYGGDSDSGLISLQDIDSEEPQLVNLTEEQYYKAFRQGYFKKAKANVSSAEEVDQDENDLDQVDQEFTSKETSINSGKLPAIYKLVNFPEGSLVIDYGGGKFDNGVEYLDSIGVTGLVYDPYNRTTEHNRSVIKQIRENGGADIALCSNVLNVIKEEEARLNVLKNIRKLLKSSGTAYITVYEGNGTGEAKQSQEDAYQLHRKTADYLDEIHKVFPDATRKGKLIIATPTGEVTASCNFNIRSSSNFDWDYKTKKVDYCPHCTNRTLVETEDSYFVCDDCGAEYEGYPTYEGGLYLKDLHKSVESGCDINAGYDPHDLGDEDLGLPFVKEDLIEFGDDIADMFNKEQVNPDVEYDYELSDIYVDLDPSGRKIILSLAFTNEGGVELEAKVALDKRRVKRWTDLYKYKKDIFDQLIQYRNDVYAMDPDYIESSICAEYDEYGKKIGSPEPEEYEFIENYKGVDIKKWVSGGDPEPSEYSKTYVTAYPNGKIFGLPFKTLYEAKSAVDDYQKSGRYYFKKSSVSASVSSNDIMKVAKAAADVTSRDDLLKVLGSLLSIDKKLYTKYSEMEKGSYSPASIGKKISDDLYYKAQSSSKVEAAVTPYKSEEFKKELQDNLYNKASEVLQTPEFGFPLNEIAEILFVEIHEDDYNIIAEVRVELSYEGMDTLARALNPIVEKYSKDAYFDMVDPGIMEAYLPKDSIKTIQSSMVTAASFQDYTDYEDPVGDTVTYDVEFDFKLTVSEDGSIDLPEDEKFESIYDDDYKIKIDDEIGVSEKILDLISYNIPDDPGMYRVSGIAKMKYDIDDIYISTVAPDWDEVDPGIEYETDDVSINFDYKGSWVEDFQLEKVD